VPIFRTPPLISDKSGGFTAFFATGKEIYKYKILKLLAYIAYKCFASIKIKPSNFRAYVVQWKEKSP
jgi:hypothetical protein